MKIPCFKFFDAKVTFKKKSDVKMMIRFKSKWPINAVYEFIKCEVFGTFSNLLNVADNWLKR